MMKNIYHWATELQSGEDHFRLEITRQSDSAGVYQLPAGKYIDDKLLPRVMQLEQVERTERPLSGWSDFMDGFTVDAQNGRIIFPVEPFGSHLKKVIGDERIAERFLSVTV